MGVNDDLLDALTEHQIHIQRLSSGTVRKILAMLKRSEARIVDRLRDADVSTLSRARQERLLTELRRIIESAYRDTTGALQLDLDQLAVYEGEFQRDLFRRVLPVKFETIAPSAEQLVAAATARPFQGRLLREVYADLEASAFRKVRDTIRLGFVEGRTTDQIVRDLRGRRSQGYKDGVLHRSRRDTEAVVRTAINHTANAAREHVYERNHNLIKGVRFNATLDARTTLICASNDGKVFEPGKGPRPPLHYNCRSSTSPVLKSWRELGFDIDELPPGTRASMDGQVPADLTYDEWLRKKPAPFQDEVLGREKGKLFRDGGMPLERFIDRRGKVFTLEELRRREGAVFSRVKVLRPLTGDEMRAVRLYSGPAYAEINAALRAGRASRYDGAVSRLDSALMAREAGERMEVYRGLNASGVAVVFPNGIVKGAVVTDPAFFSVSRSIHEAVKFAEGDGVVLRMIVEAKDNMLDIAELSQFSSEEELLLPRGFSYIVQGYDRQSRQIFIRRRIPGAP